MILLMKLIEKSCYLLINILNMILDYRWHHSPIISIIKADSNKYRDLWESSKKRVCQDVLNYEEETGFKIDENWLNDLALYTQISIKKSPLNFSHGRVLYSTLTKYIHEIKNDKQCINILETGTARGFSSLCMAKALNDYNQLGKILTIDVLPHTTDIYWNSITDHTIGKISRKKLLTKWSSLSTEYIIYIRGYTQNILSNVYVDRIHFAYLDGSHTFKNVLFEAQEIEKKQKVYDIIIFDDYNISIFPELVRAVDFFCKKFNYKKKIIKSENDRSYVVAEKS